MDVASTLRLGRTAPARAAGGGSAGAAVPSEQGDAARRTRVVELPTQAVGGIHDTLDGMQAFQKQVGLAAV